MQRRKPRKIRIFKTLGDRAFRHRLLAVGLLYSGLGFAYDVSNRYALAENRGGGWLDRTFYAFAKSLGAAWPVWLISWTAVVIVVFWLLWRLPSWRRLLNGLAYWTLVPLFWMPGKAAFAILLVASRFTA